ncbi:hypothetical protein AAG570_012929 [Ranatra chinensis]|uniref:Protein kinase domain-containing protein n=1 Tax=Ranatra chinensis TaxID=642074 RepID=A0ABD0YFA0_9HEMI
MVKKNSNFDLIKALALELKLMANLGQHLNVVNLIGACTENINNGELLVLVEYCRYGSLHGYLLRHRDAFINQINPESGIIEATTSNKAFELPYIPDASVGLRSNNTQVSEYSNLQTGNTEMTSLSTPVGKNNKSYQIFFIENCFKWRMLHRG